MNERKQKTKRQIWTTVCTNKTHHVDEKPTDNPVSVLVFTLVFLHRSKAQLLLKRDQDTSHGEEKNLRDFL